MNERELIQRWMAWKAECERKPYSQKSLAESAGISPTYLSSILSGIRNAGTRTIERIAGAFGTTLAGFYSGPPDIPERRTEPLRPERPSAVAAPSSTAGQPEASGAFPAGEPGERSGESGDGTALKLLRTSPDQIERLFDSFGYSLGDRHTLPVSRTDPPPDTEHPPVPSPPAAPGIIPLLTHIPEGHWSEWLSPDSRAVSRCIRSPLSVGGVFGVQVTDDSMVPVLGRGALALADPGCSPDAGGEIGIVAHRGGVQVRRVYAVGDLLVLVPVNPAWPPEVIPASEVRVFQVIAIVPEEKGER